MSSQINEKVGAWLLEDGHTRKVLAEEIGISRPTLGKRLNGSTEWTWNEVIEVSRVTGASLNELANIPQVEGAA